MAFDAGELMEVLEKIHNNEKAALEGYKEFLAKTGDERILRFIEAEKRHVKMVEEMISAVKG